MALFLVISADAEADLGEGGVLDPVQLRPLLPAQRRPPPAHHQPVPAPAPAPAPAQLQVEQSDQQRLVRGQPHPPHAVLAGQVVLGVAGRHQVGRVHHSQLRGDMR